MAPRRRRRGKKDRAKVFQIGGWRWKNPRRRPGRPGPRVISPGRRRDARRGLLGLRGRRVRPTPTWRRSPPRPGQPSRRCNARFGPKERLFATVVRRESELLNDWVHGRVRGGRRTKPFHQRLHRWDRVLTSTFVRERAGRLPADLRGRAPTRARRPRRSRRRRTSGSTGSAALVAQGVRPCAWGPAPPRGRRASIVGMLRWCAREAIRDEDGRTLGQDRGAGRVDWCRRRSGGVKPGRDGQQSAGPGLRRAASRARGAGRRRKGGPGRAVGHRRRGGRAGGCPGTGERGGAGRGLSGNRRRGGRAGGRWEADGMAGPGAPGGGRSGRGGWAAVDPGQGRQGHYAARDGGNPADDQRPPGACDPGPPSPRSGPPTGVEPSQAQRPTAPWTRPPHARRRRQLQDGLGHGVERDAAVADEQSSAASSSGSVGGGPRRPGWRCPSRSRPGTERRVRGRAAGRPRSGRPPPAPTPHHRGHERRRSRRRRGKHVAGHQRAG